MTRSLPLPAAALCACLAAVLLLHAAPARAECGPEYVRYHHVTYTLYTTRHRVPERGSAGRAFLPDCTVSGNPAAPPPAPSGHDVRARRLRGVPVAIALGSVPKYVAYLPGVLVAPGFFPQLRSSPLFGVLALPPAPSAKTCGKPETVQGKITDWEFATQAAVLTTADGTTIRLVPRASAVVDAPRVAGQPHVRVGDAARASGRVCHSGRLYAIDQLRMTRLTITRTAAR